MLHERRMITMDDATTLADLFNERCVRTSDGLAYVQFRDGDWRTSWGTDATRLHAGRRR